MADKDTILVVDDEEVLRQGCSRVLRCEGFEVITAAHGREALELLAAEPVNVVLCDLKMPVMGALEVLEEAGGLYPDIPVIIMTGLGTVADAVECMKKGAYDFITKPFGIEHLVLVVRRALEKQKLQEQTRRLQEAQAQNLYNLALEQSRMHTMVNCMADGVLVTNREAEVVLCNTTLLQLLGLSAALPQPGPLAAYIDDAALQRGHPPAADGGCGKSRQNHLPGTLPEPGAPPGPVGPVLGAGPAGPGHGHGVSRHHQFQRTGRDEKRLRPHGLP